MFGLAKFTISFLLQRKLRSVLTIIGIVLGTALIFSIQITKQSTIASLSSLVSDLSGSADIQITGASSGGFKEQEFEKIRNTAGIKSAVPSLTRLTFIIFKKKNKSNVVSSEKDQVQILGVDPAVDRKFRNYDLTRGRFLRSNERKAEVLLVESWATDRGLRVNDDIKIATSDGAKTFKITGLISKKGPGNVYDGSIAFINLSTAQDSFYMNGLVNQVDIKAKKNYKVTTIIRSLKDKLDSSYIVERPQSKGSSIETTTQGLLQAFNSFGILALLVGAFVVFNTMNMSISERRKQIGLLRSIGATRNQIMLMILIEALFFGIIGSLIGLFVGRFIAQATSSATASIYKTVANDIYVPFSGAMTAFLAGVIASVIAAITPAWQASSTSPISATKEELLKGRGWVEKKGWILGIVLLIISGLILIIASNIDAKIELFNVAMILLFIGVALVTVQLIIPLSKIVSPPFKLLFNPEGFFAQQNVARNKSRSSLASVIVTMGLVLIISAGAISKSDKYFVKNWLDSVVRVDLFVRTPVPFNPTATGAYPRMRLNFINKIKKVNGVDYVTPVSFLSTRGLGRDLFTIFVEPEGWKKTSRLTLEEGDPDKALKDLANPKNIVITSTISAKDKLHIGDHIKIKTNKGNINFKIVGVVAELANDGYTVYLSRSTLKKYFNIAGVDTFNILAKKGYNIETLKKKLRKEVGNPYSLLVISGLDLRKDINKSVDQFLSMLSSMALIAVLVSSLGIINTLTMNVLERIREIGVLRATGMTRMQVAKVIIAEGGIIGASGGIIGILLGLVVSRVVIVIANLSSGFPLKYFVPIESIEVAAIISIAVSTIASIYPAYKASKINVIKAVQYE